MNLSIALINWKNMARQMVGLPKLYPVKIVRSETAKAYPLIGIKKAGDVGYDLPSVETVIIPAASPRAVNNYSLRMYQARMTEKEEGMEDKANRMREEALAFLPKAVIPTGIRLQMPDNVWCSIETRSSASKSLLITPDSIIDAGYRGELFGVVYNFGYEDYHVQQGERVVQVIFHERVLADIKEVDTLDKSERGESGFGSTGSK